MRFPIPLSVLDNHVAVLGKTGSGKTSTEKLLIEHVYADGFRVCVLDTIKSDWWGITAHGTKPGLDFKILGGPRGHVPIHADAGKVIGQLVGSGKLRHSIIDMADFEAGGIQRFFVEFAPSLLRNMTGVLFLVIEEAHEIAPKERAGFDRENMAIHYAKKLATSGRSKGIRLIFGTQRVQSLHNAMLGSAETLIAHRLTTPADQEPVIKWLKANTTKEITEKVATTFSSQPTGTGWVCSGEAKFFSQVAFPKFATYDNTSTPTKDSPEAKVKTVPVDQEELKSIIGEAVEEAKANDPSELRREIARLKSELKKVPALKAQEIIKEKPLLTNSDRKRITHLIEVFERVIDLSEKAVGQLSGLPLLKVQFLPEIQFFKGALSPLKIEAARVTSARPLTARALPPPRLIKHPVNLSADISGSLPSGERKILVACAQFENVPKEDLIVITGYKRATRDAYIKRLRERGFVQDSDGVVIPTDEGMAVLGNWQPLPTGGALRNYWLTKLPSGERRILESLVESYPKFVERETLEESTGYARATRDAYLKRMKPKRIVEFRSGAVRAAEILFD